MRILRGFWFAAIVLVWGIIPPGPFGSCDLKPGEAPCCSISGVTCPNQACLCFWLCGDFSFCKCSCAGGGPVLVQVNPLLAIPLSTPFGQKNSDVVILGDLADRIAVVSNWVVTVDEGIRSRPILANSRTGTYEEVLARIIHEGSAATVDLAAISGVLAILALDVQYKYASGPKSLRAPKLAAICTVSLRTFMNNSG